MTSGRPDPLGATWDGDGVNFALYSPGAVSVEVCLFDSPIATSERARLPLPSRTADIFHGHLAGLGPGQLYGYRVYGPWDPARGLRFNPAKVLFDPYARAVGRAPIWHPSLFGYAEGSDGDGPAETTDDAPYAPLGVVVDPAFMWRNDRRPETSWSETVIYELNVKGFSATNPAVPERQRGTFLGVAAPTSIDHLRALGVTAVELMPIHAHADEWALARRGLTNYWGYNTLGFFAPDPRFATHPAEATSEFRTMVAALHAAGLEVILDVVFNHTAEGDHLGPTLSMRGIDNLKYYRLRPDRPARDQDFTGCGNTLDTRTPRVYRLVSDSLNYWAADMHVDGFRFDLAPALVRDPVTDDGLDAFFGAIARDPLLRGLKLIVEPWDAAPGGYRLGRFPPGWSEWNDRHRKTVRAFWRGDPGSVGDLATRLAGSRDLFGQPGRTPQASINYVTSHDGFTLADLVAYERKHNEANGEDNHDGESVNLSWNCGVEGPTDEPSILAERERQRRNVLLTLFVSLGVPMVSGGDELGRSQSGNNNAYCHDSPLTWTDWSGGASTRAFLGFAQRAAAIRASQPSLRRGTFLDGHRGETTDVRWLREDGQEMVDADWLDRERRTLGMELDGTLLVIFNASAGEATFALPPGPSWTRLIDTANPGAEPSALQAPTATLTPQSMAVLTRGAFGGKWP